MADEFNEDISGIESLKGKVLALSGGRTDSSFDTNDWKTEEFKRIQHAANKPFKNKSILKTNGSFQILDKPHIKTRMNQPVTYDQEGNDVADNPANSKEQRDSSLALVHHNALANRNNLPALTHNNIVPVSNSLDILNRSNNQSNKSTALALMQKASGLAINPAIAGMGNSGNGGGGSAQGSTKPWWMKMQDTLDDMNTNIKSILDILSHRKDSNYEAATKNGSGGGSPDSNILGNLGKSLTGLEATIAAVVAALAVLATIKFGPIVSAALNSFSDAFKRAIPEIIRRITGDAPGVTKPKTIPQTPAEVAANEAQTKAFKSKNTAENADVKAGKTRTRADLTKENFNKTLTKQDNKIAIESEVEANNAELAAAQARKIANTDASNAAAKKLTFNPTNTSITKVKTIEDAAAKTTGLQKGAAFARSIAGKGTQSILDTIGKIPKVAAIGSSWADIGLTGMHVFQGAKAYQQGDKNEAFAQGLEATGTWLEGGAPGPKNLGLAKNSLKGGPEAILPALAIGAGKFALGQTFSDSARIARAYKSPHVKTDSPIDIFHKSKYKDIQAGRESTKETLMDVNTLGLMGAGAAWGTAGGPAAPITVPLGALGGFAIGESAKAGRHNLYDKSPYSNAQLMSVSQRSGTGKNHQTFEDVASAYLKIDPNNNMTDTEIKKVRDKENQQRQHIKESINNQQSTYIKQRYGNKVADTTPNTSTTTAAAIATDPTKGIPGSATMNIMPAISGMADFMGNLFKQPITAETVTIKTDKIAQTASQTAASIPQQLASTATTITNQYRNTFTITGSVKDTAATQNTLQQVFRQLGEQARVTQQSAVKVQPNPIGRADAAAATALRFPG